MGSTHPYIPSLSREGTSNQKQIEGSLCPPESPGARHPASLDPVCRGSTLFWDVLELHFRPAKEASFLPSRSVKAPVLRSKTMFWSHTRMRFQLVRVWATNSLTPHWLP
jgi:hypothetical protein